MWWPLLVTAAAVVILVPVVLVINARQNHRSNYVAANSCCSLPNGPAPVDSTTTVTTPTTDTTSTAMTTTTVTPITSGASADDEQSAEDQLDQIVASDEESVDNEVLGDWVPQLSSKYNGVTDPLNGVTYDYVAILADYQNLLSSYSNALLLNSNDYSTFEQPNTYVVIVPEALSDPDDALSWCQEQGLAIPNRCLAKLISQTLPPAGTTQTTF